MFKGKKWDELRPLSGLPAFRIRAPRKVVKFPLSVKRTGNREEGTGTPWKKTMPDGREILSIAVREGWQEYRERVRLMLERQHHVCCLSRECPLCPGVLRLGEAVFEHENGRGMGGGKRDDRIVNSEGLPINGAAHYQCNRWKGSRTINYNRP